MEFNKDIEEIIDELDTDEIKGLDEKQAEQRIEENGYNELKQKPKKSIIQRFFDQLKDISLIILIIAAVISAIIAIKAGESLTDTIVILIVITLNCIIGVSQELKAEKSLESLKKFNEHKAKVIRDGEFKIIPARQVVPGDVLVLETGDYITADARLFEAKNLKVQESSLTGESVPVDKTTQRIDGETSLGDMKNMVFFSTLVTNGSGKAIVTQTGMKTQVGKIAQMLDDVEETKTPLQVKLNKLSKVLAIIAIILCCIIFILGICMQKPIMEMFMTSVSLAVAVIPESLITISTIVLAIGVQRMASKNAIIKALPSVETLGNATYICSDKTGTLTQNKMTVTNVFIDGKTFDIISLEEENKKKEEKILNKSLHKLIQAMYLCNDSKIDEENNINGDPTETALYDMAFTLGYEAQDFNFTRVHEVPFDSNRKLMSVVNKVDGKLVVFVKGGIDEILNISNTCYINGNIVSNKKEFETYKKVALTENEEMAKQSLRVLACGFKVLDTKDVDKIPQDIEKDLCFIGLVGMIDPPRAEAKKAIETTKKAGIKTVMITGDHKQTAIAIAKQLGILKDEKQAITGIELDKIPDNEFSNVVKNYSVYSRVSPEHKVKIVSALQKNDEIVAMTGDGVNDSPALKKANIGCSMGKVGTDVAKEASDVILVDDNFATIVKAVEEGRRIYDNIIKAIEFLLSSNIGETITILLTTLSMPLIAKMFNIELAKISVLLPIQILFINLVTDSFPALAFAFLKPDKDIMDRKPNKSKGIFTKGFTWRILYQGFMIGILTFVAFILGLNIHTPLNGMTLEASRLICGQTMAFLTLSIAELVHVFNVVNTQKSITQSNITQNKELILAILVSLILVLVIVFVPFFRQVFGLIILPLNKMVELVCLCVSPIIIVEIFKALKINGSRV